MTGSVAKYYGGEGPMTYLCITWTEHFHPFGEIPITGDMFRSDHVMKISRDTSRHRQGIEMEKVRGGESPSHFRDTDPNT